MVQPCELCRKRDVRCGLLPRYNIDGADESAPLLDHVDGANSSRQQSEDDNANEGPDLWIEEMYDHAVFHRVAHSACLSQQVVIAIRTIIVMYLLVATVMIIDFKIEFEDRGHSWISIFWDFPVFSWLFVVTYQIIALAWTYMHQNHPDSYSAQSSRLIRCLSVPTGKRLEKMTGQFLFTTFYFLAFTWVILNTGTWIFENHFEVVMYPEGPSDNGTTADIVDMFGPQPDEVMEAFVFHNVTGNFTTAYPPYNEVFFLHDWFFSFSYVNLFLVAHVITFLEATLLNQVKRPPRPILTLLPITLVTGLVALWSFAGALMHHYFPFTWTNVAAVGSRFWVVVSAAIWVFAGSAVSYAVALLITWGREMVEGKMDEDDEGEEEESGEGDAEEGSRSSLRNTNDGSAVAAQ